MQLATIEWLCLAAAGLGVIACAALEVSWFLERRRARISDATGTRTTGKVTIGAGTTFVLHSPKFVRVLADTMVKHPKTEKAGLLPLADKLRLAADVAEQITLTAVPPEQAGNA